jgi:hypothetical protein
MERKNTILCAVRRWSLWLLAVFLLIPALPGFSDNNSLEWVPEGIVDIYDMAVSPAFTSDGTLYAATYRGIERSATAGLTWAPLPAQPGVWVGKVVLSPSYYLSAPAGTPEATLYCVAYPDYVSDPQVFRSTDHGASWLALTPNQPIYALAISPDYPSTGKVWYGTYGGVINGVYWKQGFSDTPTWTRYDAMMDGFGYHDVWEIAPSPSYASDQCVWVTYFDSSGAVGKTSNDGASWDVKATFGGPLSLSPIYNDDFGTGYAQHAWVLNNRSTDRGDNWTFYPYPGSPDAQGYVVRVGPNYHLDNTVFLGERDSASYSDQVGLFNSSAEPPSFVRVDEMQLRNVYEIVYSPAYHKDGPDARVYCSSADHGLYISTSVPYFFTNSNDLGETVPDDVVAVAVHPTNFNEILVVSETAGVYRSTNGGVTFFNISYDLPLGPSFYCYHIEYDPSTATPVLGTSNGIYYLSGTNWIPSNLGGTLVYSLKIIDNGQDVSLWASSDNGIWKGSSGGAVWTQKSTEQHVQELEGHIINVAGGGIPRLGPGGITLFNNNDGGDGPIPNPAKSVMWGGTSIGGGGQGFGDVVRPGDGAPVLLAAGGVLKSEDGGETWQESDGNACALSDLNVYAIIALQSGTVLAGTNTGIYRSTDGGSCWLPADTGLYDPNQDVATFHESCYGDNGLRDILAAIISNTTGGVYFSADDGEHWVPANEGLDENTLNVYDITSDSNPDCSQVTYYLGKDYDGVWSSRIAPRPAPFISSLDKYCGPPSGGTAVMISGSDFRTGAVVEFGGVPASGVVLSNCVPDPQSPAGQICSQIDCLTPSGTAGANVVVRVRNTDTRTGKAPSNFTYSKAAFTHDAPQPCGTPVNFDSSASKCAVSYLWDFGDGMTSTQASPSHVYGATGTFLVVLTITDGEGAQHSAQQFVDVLAASCPPGEAGGPGMQPLRILSRDANSITFEPAPGATAYNIYADAMGSWYSPTAAEGTVCTLTSWTVNGDGTITINFTVPDNTWILVEPSNAYGEGTPGDDSAGTRRDNLGSWPVCPLGP